jgi:colanic acid biosynthesis glycosyl transferase WcaI
MAAGRPIIASVDADSDTARWITESGCGLVTAPQDAEALAEAVRVLRGNPERAAEMGERGRAHLLTRFSRESVTRQYDALFREVATARPSRAE